MNPRAREVVDAAEAHRIALQMLAEVEQRSGIPCVLIGEPEDHGRWWVQGYQSRAFMEDGDVMQALAGNGPFAIPKDGSAPFPLGTAEPADVMLARLRQGESS